VSGPDDLLYWLWLARTLGPGNLYTKSVLDAFGSARSAWEARTTGRFKELAGEAAAERANRPENAPETFRAFTRECVEKHIQILPYGDPDYPDALCRIPDMPVVLYCTGNPQWLNAKPAVGIVGSRKATRYGENAVADIGGGLARNGVVIVSGLADGLDSRGHEAAVKYHCPTIGVLGVPIDRTYPSANYELRKKIEAKGCIISEYPPDSEYIGPNGFLLRNRLIAALSSALVVAEAKEKSGTMSTVAHAERYGKKNMVFAVPGSIYSPNSAGTNGLLRDGRARAVCKAEDILEALEIRPRNTTEVVEKKPDLLTEAERKVLAHIGPKPVSMEELCVSTGLPATAVLTALMKLEISRHIIKQPGQRYILR